MKKSLFVIAMAVLILSSCEKKTEETDNGLFTPAIEDFDYVVDRFADIEILRYRVPGIENLSLQQQEMLYYLSEAALCGRDIIYDQNCRYNLAIRTLLESVYTMDGIDTTSADFKAMEVYLKRVWASNGIHHHYSGMKFEPDFSQAWFETQINNLPFDKLPIYSEGMSRDELFAEILPVIFDPTVMAVRKNQTEGADLLLTSACNYYDEGITQAEAEAFYSAMRTEGDETPVSYGLNSRLVRRDGCLVEDVYKTDGLYGSAMTKIVYWLEKAEKVCENDAQRNALQKMISFYRTGNLKEFDEYAILWLQDTESLIDYVCGYTETYGDPLGYKANWEAVINFKDVEATKRTEKISNNAQWFEDHSPVDSMYKKEKCKGVTAKVITAAMMGGDNYPMSALGINLPNADWIRAAYGSKSVTIDNIAEAYAQSVKSSGFNHEFVVDARTEELLSNYKEITDNLHTDLHECLGHGSGKLAPGVSPDALGKYHAVIEEARADLFGLYYVADTKLVELGLLPDTNAYMAQYYSYLMNGLMTQTTRIKLGDNIEQTHMRNRQLIGKWVLEHSAADNAVELIVRDGKHYLVVNDYTVLRQRFGELLREIQRIKSSGDYNAARDLVENYSIKIDQDLHKEILDRYATLDMAPYKGFINPVLKGKFDNDGKFTGLSISYDENFVNQHLRYSRDYSFLKK